MNVVGQLRVLQAFLPALRRRRGRIVLMGSIGGPLGAAVPRRVRDVEVRARGDGGRAARRARAVGDARGRSSSRARSPRRSGRSRSGPSTSCRREAVELYGERLDGSARSPRSAPSAHAVPAVEVAKAVEHALTAKQPRTRYVVGPDAKRRARVQKLPDRLRDRVLTRFLFGS